MFTRARVAMAATATVLFSLLVPAAAASAVPAGAPTTASALLAELTVSPASSVKYDRDRFAEGLDLDGDGCRTRQDLLEEEGVGAYGYDCVTLGGTWTSWYDGQVITDPAALEMDHLVALAEAWRSGAHAWTDEQRALFANDMDIPQSLNLVSAAVNNAKADRDPAQWLPPLTPAHCRYVTEWVTVKWRWNLSVDSAERAAIENTLAGDCGQQTITAPPKANTTAPAPAISFTDTSGHVFEKEVAWLAAKGVTRGWEVGPGRYEFRPNAFILRGETAAFLYRMAGSPAFTPPTTSPFIDVPTSFVFYKEIAWLASAKISEGWATPNGAEFRPFTTTSRDVMAAFLHRFEGKPPLTNGANPFQDIYPGTVFRGEILWLAGEGISTGWDVGYGCREYRPFQQITRSEMAAFLYRLANGGTTPVTDNTCAPPAPAPSPLVGDHVTAGAFCAAERRGWYGYTSTGILMKCTTSSTDSRLRWRQV